MIQNQFAAVAIFFPSPAHVRHWIDVPVRAIIADAVLHRGG